jgi:hypothetical protein
MGGETTTSRTVVKSAGHAYRLNGQLLKDDFFRAGPMQRLLLRYTQALLTQMSQTAVQPASFDRPAIVPLAAVEPGPPVLEQPDHDTGIDRQHARRAPRRRHRGGRVITARRLD